jgi:hypothetical protein
MLLAAHTTGAAVNVMADKKKSDDCAINALLNDVHWETMKPEAKSVLLASFVQNGAPISVITTFVKCGAQVSDAVLSSARTARKDESEVYELLTKYTPKKQTKPKKSSSKSERESDEDDGGDENLDERESDSRPGKSEEDEDQDEDQDQDQDDGGGEERA